MNLHRVADSFRSAVGQWTPVPTKSQFKEEGYLTPKEFVDAGDQLVFKFPTWRWMPADSRREVSWLPKDKQYLLTDNVPCRSRVRDLDVAQTRIVSDGWMLPGIDEEESAPVPDGAVLQASAKYFVRETDGDGGGILLSRSYDVSITYDKYYQTPRIWLFGYDEEGQSLPSKEVFEDILAEYATRTVTVDPHPCTGIPTVSIHPCKHASVMKKVVGSWLAKGQEARHDLALFVLLKFVQSIVPTVDYDFTMDIDMGFTAATSSS